MPIADDFPKLPFRYHQAAADPALNLISVAPALHIPTDCLHNREGRFDHVRAGQGSAELLGHTQLVNGERLFQSLLQTACRTRIDIHEFPMQAIQRALGLAEQLEWLCPRLGISADCVVHRTFECYNVDASKAVEFGLLGFMASDSTLAARG